MRGVWMAAALAFSAAHAQAADSAAVEAERAYAARAQQVGFRAATLEFAAADGVVFEPAPTPAHKVYGEAPPEPPGPSPLVWWPVWSGASAAGDLGFNAGPFTIGGDRRFGHFFTVWKRQPDGRYLWIYDGGPPAKAPSRYGKDAPVRTLPTSPVAPIPREQAWREVAAAEAALAENIIGQGAAALQAVLAEDAWIMGTPVGPAVAANEHARELAARPSGYTGLKPLGGEAAESGDIVFTYGEARWSGAAPDAKGGWGHYVRVWQRRPEGWRLVFDQLLEARAA